MTTSIMSVLSSFAVGLVLGVWLTARLAQRDHPDDMRDSIHYGPEELFDDKGRSYYETGHDERDAGLWD